MKQTQTSSLDQIHQTLKRYNPFAKPACMNDEDVWGENFVDFAQINAHASDLVFQALQNIHLGLYSTTSMVITAHNGTGKTHIIGRIRHQLQQNGKGLFIYINEHDVHQSVKHQFQQKLSNSLAKIGYCGVKQWQEIGALMAKNCHPKLKNLKSPEQLLKIFAEESNQTKVNRFIHNLVEYYCNIQEVEDPDIIQGIFWTLSPNKMYQSSAIKWLGGQEISPRHYKILGLPSQNQSFNGVIQILKIIGNYKKLVICFDELDTVDSINTETGLHISVLIAGLIKDLFQNLKKGVILSVMMPKTWNDNILLLPVSARQKMNAEMGEKPLTLKYINSSLIVDFIAWWLESYYHKYQIIPPHPIYPFSEAQLQEVAKEGSTMRDILEWCKQNCKPPKAQDFFLIKENPVEAYFLKEMEKEIEEIEFENNHLIANALLFSFKNLIGKTMENIKLEQVTDQVVSANHKDKALNFKITALQNQQKIIIGVAVLQYAGGKVLGAGLAKLNDYKKFGLTRGCLLRSKDKKLNPYMTNKYLKPLIKEKKGGYVELKKEELKPLLAIFRVHKKRVIDYNVTLEEIIQFIAQKSEQYLLGENNPLIKEILREPSDFFLDLLEDESETNPEILQEIKEEDNDLLFSSISINI
jgi:hypothetical protein